MRKINILLLSILLLAGCSIDNYDEATGVIEGGVYDAQTGELIPAQAPNGARISLYQEGYTQPINFWCKTDGSFYNKRVFNETYRVVPEGPFIVNTEDEVTVTVPTKEKIEFRLEPFLRIQADANLSGNDATLNFTINASDKWTGTLNQYAILYSWTQNIDINNYKFRESINVSAEQLEEILGKKQTFTVKDTDSAKPVYVRVAARTSGTTYYNYSEIIQLK